MVMIPYVTKQINRLHLCVCIYATIQKFFNVFESLILKEAALI